MWVNNCPPPFAFKSDRLWFFQNYTPRRIHSQFQILSENPPCQMQKITAGVPGFRRKLTEVADCVKYKTGKQRIHGWNLINRQFAQASRLLKSKTCRILKNRFSLRKPDTLSLNLRFSDSIFQQKTSRDNFFF